MLPECYLGPISLNDWVVFPQMPPILYPDVSGVASPPIAQYGNCLGVFFSTMDCIIQLQLASNLPVVFLCVFFSMLNRLNALLVFLGGGQEEKKLLRFSNLQKEVLKGTFLSWKVPAFLRRTFAFWRIALGLISLGAGIRILGVWGDKRIYELFTTMGPLFFRPPGCIFRLVGTPSKWPNFMASFSLCWWSKLLRSYTWGPAHPPNIHPVDDFFGRLELECFRKIPGNHLRSRESLAIENGQTSSSAESDFQTSPQYHSWQR